MSSGKNRTAVLLLVVAALSSADTLSTLPPKSRKRGLAILSSVVLPGSGQMILGSKKRGEAVMWVEGAAWALWAGFSWSARTQESSARLYAAREAGAYLELTEARYYRALERYDNSDEYNEDIRRDARDRYPDDPARQLRYYDSLRIFGPAAWDWSSDSARFDYWRQRKSARTAMLSAEFCTAALVLNRLVSVVDCAFFASEPVVGSRVEFVPAEGEPGIKVCYRF